MERYTLQKRIEIVKIHYKNGENFTETVRKVKSSLANTVSVAHSMKKNPSLAIPHRSLGLGISQTSLHRILWPDLEDMDVDDAYMQQDGATCHTNGETIGLLRQR